MRLSVRFLLFYTCAILSRPQPHTQHTKCRIPELVPLPKAGPFMSYLTVTPARRLTVRISDENAMPVSPHQQSAGI